MNDARGSAAYKRLRAAMRAQGLPCGICGRQIDYFAKPKTRWSFSVDHIRPLSMGGNPTDPTNCRPAHLGCNSSRAAKYTRNGITPPSGPHVTRDTYRGSIY